jgi:hypothetical protein
MLPDVVQTDDMSIDAVLWSIDVLVYHAMYNVHIIDQRRMLCMPSIDACYTCHQLCHNSMLCVVAINSIYYSIMDCWDMLHMLPISATFNACCG